MNRVATAGMTLLLLTLVGCGDASTFDVDAGDASVQLDGAVDDDAQTSADGATCSSSDVTDLCSDICEAYTIGACGSETKAECMAQAGWCGARARARTAASGSAVWSCMMMHVSGSTVSCVPMAACWDAVSACL